MADDKKTQVKEPEKETPNEDSYEKRYKDSQAHITTIEQENKDLRDAADKDKELLDTVSKYVDWDAAGGNVKAEDNDDDGYVDKKTYKKTVKDLQDLINRNTITQGFRSKYPDMVKYEDLVGVFLNKTDARRPMDERIDKAVVNVKKLIESERIKGREDFEKEKKEKAAKEAEAGGLSGGKVPEGKKKEPDGETPDDYLKSRKAQLRKAKGLE